jgi:Holliday junction resolvase RusA-like endonuclease
MTRNTSDIDNWAKMVLDAGNGTLWKDDCQVVVLEVSKCWVLDDQGEGILVQVTEVTDQDVHEATEEVLGEPQ